jgi:hypothetical protein
MVKRRNVRHVLTSSDLQRLMSRFRLPIPNYRNDRRKDFPTTVSSSFSLPLLLIEDDTLICRCQKQNLSACVVDEAEDTARHFTQDDLRQLFKFNTDTMCDTHDTFKCKRCRDGKQHIKAPALLYGDSSTYVFSSPSLCSSPLFEFFSPLPVFTYSCLLVI